MRGGKCVKGADKPCSYLQETIADTPCFVEFNLLSDYYAVIITTTCSYYTLKDARGSRRGGIGSDGLMVIRPARGQTIQLGNTTFAYPDEWEPMLGTMERMELLGKNTTHWDDLAERAAQITLQDANGGGLPWWAFCVGAAIMGAVMVVSWVAKKWLCRGNSGPQMNVTYNVGAETVHTHPAMKQSPSTAASATAPLRLAIPPTAPSISRSTTSSTPSRSTLWDSPLYARADGGRALAPSAEATPRRAHRGPTGTKRRVH
jgi:hypothetical protein